MEFHYLAPFVGALIACLVMVGIADLLIAPLVMMLATSTLVLITLGLSATVPALALQL